jgi:chemotaxis protein MotA
MGTEDAALDLGTVIGVIIACAAVGFGILVGGNPAALIDVPSALIVIGGAVGATVMSFPLARVLKIHSVVLKSVFGKVPDPVSMIKDLVKYAEVARREGILSLESMIGDMKDDFLVRGIKMAVDGTDPELIRTILDTELEAMMGRHSEGKKVLDTIGKYAPAFGMIGTLLGLIFMLGNMDDPSAIGPGMAVALITTLYGAMLSNMFTGPIADKLSIKDSEEILAKTIIIAGVMAIQSGDNPRVVESKLLTYLPPAQRVKAEAAKAA